MPVDFSDKQLIKPCCRCTRQWSKYTTANKLLASMSI